MNHLLNARGRLSGFISTMMLLTAVSVFFAAAPPATAQDTPSLDDALKAISTYEFGQTREPLSVVEDLVKASHGDPGKRAEIEKKFAAVLGSNATYDCKDFICRQLNIIGSEAVVPALAPMLTDEKLSDMARYAIEGIQGESASKALSAALGKTTGRVKVGIINSIGARRAEGEVPALAKLLKDKDTAVGSAAAAALGHIGGQAAADALAAARAGASPELRQPIDDGYLMCAARFDRDGQKDQALAIYTALNTADVSRQTRIAAIEGTVAVQGVEALPALLELLKGDNVELQAIAAGALRTLEGAGIVEALAGALPNLTPTAQVLTLYALRQRADGAALEAVTAASKSADPEVRVAALETLGTVGNASSVPLLLQVATSPDADAAHAASASLDALRGDDVDGVLMSATMTSSGQARVEAIRSLSIRGAVSAVPTLLQTAADADDAVRIKSFDALGALAGADQLPALVSLLVQMSGNTAQSAAEGAVVAVAQKIEPADQRAETILSALTRLKGKSEVRASFVRVLGRIGDPSALPELRRLANQQKNNTVMDAAIRALTDWPTADTMEDLRQLAVSASNDTYKALAFRGFVRELRLPSDRSVESTLKLFSEASKLAATPDDKRMILAGLAEINDSRALTLVEPYLADESVKAEAAQAAEQIKKNTQK